MSATAVAAGCTAIDKMRREYHFHTGRNSRNHTDFWEKAIDQARSNSAHPAMFVAASYEFTAADFYPAHFAKTYAVELYQKWQVNAERLKWIYIGDQRNFVRTGKEVLCFFPKTHEYSDHDPKAFGSLVTMEAAKHGLSPLAKACFGTEYGIPLKARTVIDAARQYARAPEIAIEAWKDIPQCVIDVANEWYM